MVAAPAVNIAAAHSASTPRARDTEMCDGFLANSLMPQRRLRKASSPTVYPIKIIANIR